MYLSPSSFRSPLLAILLFIDSDLIIISLTTGLWALHDSYYNIKIKKGHLEVAAPGMFTLQQLGRPVHAPLTTDNLVHPVPTGSAPRPPGGRYYGRTGRPGLGSWGRLAGHRPTELIAR